uniref:Uncharacterized protein n=1 Tax=Ditylenchus dipsaci TaxID=166011 RepID=A0A915D4B0_9BILA
MENPNFLSREERNEMIKELMALKKRAIELPTLLKRIYERIETIEEKLGLKVNVTPNKPGALQQNSEPLPSSSVLPTPRVPNPLPSSGFFTNNRYGTDGHRPAADKIKTWKDLAEMDLDVIQSAYGQHVAAKKTYELPQPPVPPPRVVPACPQPHPKPFYSLKLALQNRLAQLLKLPRL